MANTEQVANAAIQALLPKSGIARAANVLLGSKSGASNGAKNINIFHPETSGSGSVNDNA